MTTWTWICIVAAIAIDVVAFGVEDDTVRAWFMRAAVSLWATALIIQAVS